MTWSARTVDALKAERRRVLDRLRGLDGGEPLVVELEFIDKVLFRVLENGAGQATLFPETGERLPSGLRDAIRAVLQMSDRALKPREVTQQLQTGGFQSNGKIALGPKVSAEMGRMRREGKLRRWKGGRYRLPKEEQEASA